MGPRKARKTRKLSFPRSGAPIAGMPTLADVGRSYLYPMGIPSGLHLSWTLSIRPSRFLLEPPGAAPVKTWKVYIAR
ncbi:MAG: hypothetical protein ACXW00_11590 [Methylobacter sp.]